jgi:predicted alpha/beta hydrolase
MTEVRLRAADGHELGALYFPSNRPRTRRRVAVIHCGAGIPAQSYRAFAQFLSEWGISVLIYDYRGIGMSRPANLRGFEAGSADWFEFDAAAAIAWLRERFPDDELVGISHSIGGLALAGAPNSAQQDRLVFIAPHTGYFGDYHLAYRLPMAVLWHAVMPVTTHLMGYFPARRLRLGEDLPAGVAMEWARRRSPELRPRGDQPAAQRIRRLLDQAAFLEGQALALTVADDAFATAQGARRLFSYFPRLTVRSSLLTPAQAGVARLGHFGFFRRQVGARLWPRFLELLEG